MILRLSVNTSLSKRLFRLFILPTRPAVRQPDVDDSAPKGITRTLFEDNVVKYPEPVLPSEVKQTAELVARFGRKQPVNFRQMTLAVRN